jgi:Zn-dependent protease with chaperone function
MKNKELEQQILDLAAMAGIDQGRIFEVDKSQETSTLNAYVVGFGHTKRIVLWDTLIQNMSAPQILFVVGHEMGHYVLHHMWWGFSYFSILLVFIFYGTYRGAFLVLRRFQHRFGFAELSSFASLPLLLFLFTFLSLATDPLTNFVSRTIERQADRFGLDMTHDNQAAGEAFVILQQKKSSEPAP